MTANELRIGNYVELLTSGGPIVLPSGVYRKIGSLTPFDCSLYEIDKPIACQKFEHYTNLNYIGPISLTEEWLLKFGWVWNEETKSYEKFPDGDARMHLQHVMNGYYTMFNYVLSAVIREKIRYVHQLQNLSFALTGEELIARELAT